MKPKPAKPAVVSSRVAIEWLSQEAGFRELAQRIEGLARLQGLLDRCGLKFAVQVLAVDADTLVVATRSASQAALLRQQGPSLLAALNARGVALKNLRARVRPDLYDRRLRPVNPRSPIPAKVLSDMSTMAEQNADSGLGRALGRLVLRQHRPGASKA